MRRSGPERRRQAVLQRARDLRERGRQAKRRHSSSARRAARAAPAAPKAPLPARHGMSDVDWNNLKHLPAGLKRGYGAWDCDANALIPPERECYVFEEIPNMDYPWEGMPTVPPHKDRENLSFFTEYDKRFKIKASPDEDVADVKKRMFDGGMNAKQNPGTQFEALEDIVLWYAGQVMKDGHRLSEYRVPPGCKCIMAKHRKWIGLDKPPPEGPGSDYWL